MLIFGYIVLLTLLYKLTGGIWRNIIHWAAIIIGRVLENKRKYTCRAVLVVDRFLSLPPLNRAYFWICGAPTCGLHAGRWRLETHSPARFWFMLNSSSSIFRLVRLYSDLWRSNRWMILILRYIVHNTMIYILTVAFKVIIKGGWVVAIWIYC